MRKYPYGITREEIPVWEYPYGITREGLPCGGLPVRDYPCGITRGGLPVVVYPWCHSDVFTLGFTVTTVSVKTVISVNSSVNFL